ncbi:cytotoxin [Lederbergia sp. NSJ-179]|uniref:cytotoxin n=1 Tax=Lederbergia sp. NSJ-179 TaxID=2931402 RepID=UPI001FD1B95F|nr:cytotoxin [Lederbergia sp. NSJ-179]MCJ7840759.1 cytotoxin [Lederbergia sp. NSJ-179]
MNLIPTARFTKALSKLDPESKIVIQKAMSLMLEDLNHPSLRVKKMKGYHNPKIWETSGNMDLRITFEFRKPDQLILRNCGHHDDTLDRP